MSSRPRRMELWTKTPFFFFEQDADKVKAKYAGGPIRAGFLVGQLTDNILKFTYCQQRSTGELDHGESTCMLSVDESSGKLKLQEQFKMSTQNASEEGINIFMEV